MAEIFPLVERAFRMDLELCRDRKIRQHDILLQIQYFHLGGDEIGIVDRFRYIVEELAHLFGVLEIELVIRELKTPALRTATIIPKIIITRPPFLLPRFVTKQDSIR